MTSCCIDREDCNLSKKLMIHCAGSDAGEVSTLHKTADRTVEVMDEELRGTVLEGEKSRTEDIKISTLPPYVKETVPSSTPGEEASLMSPPEINPLQHQEGGIRSQVMDTCSDSINPRNPFRNIAIAQYNTLRIWS